MDTERHKQVINLVKSQTNYNEDQVKEKKVQILVGMGWNSEKERLECIIPWNQILYAKKLELISSEKDQNAIFQLKKDCKAILCKKKTQ